MKKTVWVFVIFFAIFLAGQASIRGFWSQDDPYYHARHSALMAESGNLTMVAPWLTMHFFSFAPTDPWWGYHVLMAGFIRVFGTVWGSKVLSALLAALTFALFYYILTVYKVRRPWLWTALFWASSSLLLSRLLLARPHLLAAPAFLLAWLFSARRQYYALFGLTVLYTLFYHQSPLLLTVVLAVLVGDFFREKAWNWKLPIAGLGGILAGIVLHPQSLNYVYVMFISIWQVLALLWAGVYLGVGGELITMPFLDLLKSSTLALGFFITATAFLWTFYPHTKKFGVGVYGLALASGFWLLTTLAVPRAADYFLPLGWLFVALTFAAVAETGDWNLVRNWFKKFIVTKLTRPFIYIGLIVVLFNNLWQLGLLVAEHNNDPFPEQIRAAAEWLKENTPDGSVVFYDNWGYWPLMFYYNQQNRYLNGMDPTFSYDYDPKLFWLWRNISSRGYACAQEDGCPQEEPRRGVHSVADAVRNQFGSEYMLIKNEPASPLYRVLATQKQDFERVFANEGFLIYRIKSAA